MRDSVRVHRGAASGTCLLVRNNNEAVLVEGCSVSPLPGFPPALGPAIEELAGLFGLVTVAARAYLVGIRDTEAAGVLAGAGHRLWRVRTLSLVRVADGVALGAGVPMTPEEDEFQGFLRGFAFHFSPDYDFTHTLQRVADSAQELDRRFYWNAAAAKPFADKGVAGWIQPVCDAFVGVAEEAGLQYVLISRRSRRRQGARYLVRGADLLGNVANFVETEQIVSVGKRVASFVQVRGSMPVCWQQRGEGGELMPLPRMTYPPLWSVAHDKHWEEMMALYGGDAVVVNLVDQHGAEGVVGQAFESAVRGWNSRHPQREIRVVWFDFHLECKKAGYQVLGSLADRVLGSAESTFFCPGSALAQRSVLRTNCIDCLDRTNVVQSVFGRKLLDKMVLALGGSLSLLSESFEQRLKHVWVDNADAMSIRYTGVGALKTDFTRSGKRSGKGMAQDAIKSVQRLAQHKFRDGDKQIFTDLLLGLQTSRERRTPERTASNAFYASVVGAGPDTLDTGQWLQSVGTALALVEVGPIAVVKYLVSHKMEQTFARERIFAVHPLLENPTGARIVWRDQPEPLKLFFFSAAVRDRFVACFAVADLLDLSPPPMQVLLVSWRSVQLPSTETCVPGTSLALAQRMFGCLPEAGAGVVVLALQDVAQAALPLDDPFVDSKGLSAEMYVVTLFQMYIGPSYELVQCVHGAGATRLAVWLHSSMAPQLLASHACSVDVVGGGGEGGGGSSSAGSGTGTMPRKSLAWRVKAQLSGPAVEEESHNGVGCAVSLVLRGVRGMVFLNTGDCAEPRSGLALSGAHAAHFHPFNIVAPGRNVFWMGTNPFAFPVAAFSGLASNAAAGHIVARCSGLTQLLSSDAMVGGALPAAMVEGAVSRPVACCFSLPVEREEAAAAAPPLLLSVTVWDATMQCDSVGREDLTRLELSSERQPVAGAVRSPGTRQAGWPAPMTLTVRDGPFVDVAISVVTEQRNRLIARAELSLRAVSARDVPCTVQVDLFDANSSVAGWVRVSLRWSVASHQPRLSDPVLELLGRAPSAVKAAVPPPVPPPVPQRPHKPI